MISSEQAIAMSQYHNPYLLGLSPYVKPSSLGSADKICKAVGHNTGNLAFHHAISLHINNQIDVVEWGCSSQLLYDESRIAVVPCANQLGEHTDLGGLAKLFANIKSPIVAIGLGAQSNMSFNKPQIPQGTIEWLEQIIKHAPSSHANISIRGDFTGEVLRSYGIDNFVVTGCPSNFINPSPFLGKLIANNFKKPTRIAVAAGHPGWKSLEKIEQNLFRLAASTQGAYIAQSPKEIMSLVYGNYADMDENEFLRLHKYIAPDINCADFKVLIKKIGFLPTCVKDWMTLYREHDFVIGARFHGIMLALQAGIPALCIAHDSRTIELCDTMKVPYLTPERFTEDITPEWLHENWSFSSEDFDKKRRELGCSYFNFLNSNGIVSTQCWSDFQSSVAIRPVNSCTMKKLLKDQIQKSNATAFNRYPEIFARTFSLMNASSRCLDVLSFGCSTGEEVATLDQLYLENSNIYGVDISRHAIANAKTYKGERNSVIFFHSSDFDTRLRFDVVFAMSVLCRWPEAEKMHDISSIYSFNDFEHNLQAIAEFIRPGGILVINNSNYYFEDTQVYARDFSIADIETNDIGFVKRFDRVGIAYVNSRPGHVIFRRKAHG